MPDAKTNIHLLRCARMVAAHKEPSHITVARATGFRKLVDDTPGDPTSMLLAIQEACSGAEIAEKSETTVARAQAYHVFLEQ